MLASSMWVVLRALCLQILGLLVTYFLLVVQFAGPAARDTTSMSAVSSNYTALAI